MTTLKAAFVKRVIKNALRIRHNEIEIIGDRAYLIPLNFVGTLRDGDRFENDLMFVTVLENNLFIVRK